MLSVATTTTGWQKEPLMRSNSTILLASALAFGLVMTSCSKQKVASTATNSSVEASNQVAASPGGAAVENDMPQTRDLQASVDAYVKIYKRKPASLEQLVKEGFLAVLPAAPPGKRFAFDSSTARVSVVPR